LLLLVAACAAPATIVAVLDPSPSVATPEPLLHDRDGVLTHDREAAFDEDAGSEAYGVHHAVWRVEEPDPLRTDAPALASA
ncbi:MAG: hypothetical protein ACREQ9_12940, partial [Candidatus Binatia bacterium]